MISYHRVRWVAMGTRGREYIGIYMNLKYVYLKGIYIIDVESRSLATSHVVGRVSCIRSFRIKKS